jgi:perosamine synthetase
VDDVEAPLADDADHRRSWFVYVVKLAAGVDRDGVIARLAADGVASKPYLPAIHLQPYFRERFGYREGMLPVTEETSARTLALPFHSRLAAEDQGRVVDALVRALSVGGPAH